MCRRSPIRVGVRAVGGATRSCPISVATRLRSVTFGPPLPLLWFRPLRNLMLLPAGSELHSASGPEGQPKIVVKIQALSNKLRELFNLCPDCVLQAMSCIPPSAFSAKRIRDTQRDMKVSNTTKGGNSPKYFNTNFMELTPLKYNSKLMNSIWGFYNRYSPHNVKKVNDAFVFPGDSQQYATSSNVKNDAVLGLPAPNLDVWTSINITQSH